jgi:hypothetical protein
MQTNPTGKQQFITAQASNADHTSGVLDVRNYRAVWLEIDIDDTTDPSADVYVLGGLTKAIAELRPLKLAEGDLSTEAGVTLDDGGHVVVTGASLTAPVRIQIAIADPPPYLAVFYDRSSGGATGNRLNAYWFGRP